MRSFQLNKESLKKIHLPIRSLEINLGNQIIKERQNNGISINCYIIRFINEAISGEDRIFLNRLKAIKATLLWAHGKNHKRWKWYFVDNGHAKSVAKWVREKDGKFDLIILIVCNPGKYKQMQTKKSLLIMPSNIFSFQYLSNRWVKVKLIKPSNP